MADRVERGGQRRTPDRGAEAAPHDRCPVTGRMLPGHTLTRRHGLRSSRVPAAFRRVERRVVAAQLGDDGEAPTARRLALVRNFALVQRHITMLDAYLQRTGLADEAGGLRREARDLLCGFVRTAQLLGRVLGLDCRPRDLSVVTLADYLATTGPPSHEVDPQGMRPGCLAASTWNKYRGLVLTLQRWGLRKGYLTSPWLSEVAVKAPEATVKRRKGAQRSRRLVPDTTDARGQLVPGEERRLLAAANPWLQRLILAALETGARRGELLALQWRDVSLVRGELTFREETTKTRHARTIPISPALRAVLDLLRLNPTGRELPPHAHVFGDRAEGTKGTLALM